MNESCPICGMIPAWPEDAADIEQYGCCAACHLERRMAQLERKEKERDDGISHDTNQPQ